MRRKNDSLKLGENSKKGDWVEIEFLNIDIWN